jgi:hypothetical protein
MQPRRPPSSHFDFCRPKGAVGNQPIDGHGTPQREDNDISTRLPPGVFKAYRMAWSIGELLDAAVAVAAPDPVESPPDLRRRFLVIEGGKGD